MTSSVYGGDEVGALVFDVGSYSFRSGFAGEDSPKADVPSAAGVLSATNSTHSNQNKLLFDTTNIRVPKSGMEITPFLKDCMIEDWNIFERLLEYNYKFHMHTVSENHPVLMSEVPWNTRNKREQLTELMFEKFNIPAFYLAKNAVLSAFANGRTSAIVLDSGHQYTFAVPVWDGYVLQQSLVRSPLAGAYILKECENLITGEGIDPIPSYMIGSKEHVGDREKPVWTRKKNLCEVTKSFSDYMVGDLMSDFAASVLQVMDTPYDAVLAEQMPTVHYEFPNGYNQDFGSDRFLVCETLFDQTKLKGFQGNSMLGVANVVMNSANMCDVDIRHNLYSSVICTGGNSLLLGFVDRLTKDVTARSPSSVRVKVLSGGTTAERRFSSWIGGSILASLGSFQQMWISKQEYQESGKVIVDKKCP